MARRPRSELPDGFYHVTARAVSGDHLFADDQDRRAFVWLLGLVVVRFELACLAFCLMGTHYHLLLESRRDTLSAAMKSLNGRYARRYNERHARQGHVFAERFSAYVIKDESHLDETCRYIAANPVRAGLCDGVGDWPWTWIASEHGATGRSIPAVPQPTPPRVLRLELQGQT